MCFDKSDFSASVRLHGEVQFSIMDQIIIIRCVCFHECVCCFVDVCGREGAHGCFLWENGRPGMRGQCLRGSQWGWGEVRFGANASR